MKKENAAGTARSSREGNAPFRRRNEHSLGNRIRKYKESYLLIAPFMILFTIFTVIPVLASVGLSFTSFNMLQMPRFMGFQNYERLFLDDPIFFTVLKNTLVFAFLTGPLSYILSFLFAWLINETGRKMRTFLTLIFYLPVLSGNIYFVWAFLFSSDSYGVINGLLMNMNVIQEPIGWLIDQNSIMSVLIVVQLWMSLGTGFLTFVAGFQGMEQQPVRGRAIDGCAQPLAGTRVYHDPLHGAAAALQRRHADRGLLRREHGHRIPRRVPDHPVQRRYARDVYQGYRHDPF